MTLPKPPDMAQPVTDGAKAPPTPPARKAQQPVTDGAKAPPEKPLRPPVRSARSLERQWQYERDLLVAVLSTVWESHITPAAKSGLLWSEVVCIHSPVGQDRKSVV